MARDIQQLSRKRLEALQAKLNQDVAVMSEETRRPSGGQGNGELTNVPFHLGDLGTDEYLQDLNTTLLENEEYLQGEVRDALRRLDAGTFGTCEECRQPIRTERLEAIPYARYCVKCAEALDHGFQTNFNTGRPQSTDDTLAPEGEMGETRFASRRDAARGRADGDEVADHDRHAVGEAGGGTAMGGLAGSPSGRGEPDLAAIEDASGSGHYDARDQRATKERVEKF